MKIIPNSKEITKLRISKGFSLEALAKKAEVAVDTVRRMELGYSPRPCSAKKVQQALESEYENIFTIE